YSHASHLRNEYPRVRRYTRPFPTRRSSDLARWLERIWFAFGAMAVLVLGSAVAARPWLGVPAMLVVVVSPLAAGFAAFIGTGRLDRKSTRLNSSHGKNSYADFCLKKNKRSH